MSSTASGIIQTKNSTSAVSPFSFFSLDHKATGLKFVAAASFFLLVGLAALAAALFKSSESVAPDVSDYIVQLWSASGEAVVFAGVLPLLLGIGLYIVPLQIGAAAIAYTRGAATAFWLWFFGVTLLVVSYLLNGGPGGGKRDFVALWFVALAMVLIGLIWVMIAMAASIFAGRAQGMLLERAPYTTWAFLIFSLAGLVLLSVTAAELLLGYVRFENGLVALVDSGQLLPITSSFFTPPAVYILCLPILGVIADIVEVHGGLVLKGRAVLMTLIGALGSIALSVSVLSFASVRSVNLDSMLLVGLIAIVPLVILLFLGGIMMALKSQKHTPTPPLVISIVALLMNLASVSVSLLGVLDPVIQFLKAETTIELVSPIKVGGTAFYDGVYFLVVGSALLGSLAAVAHWSVKLFGRQIKAPVTYLSAFLLVLGTASLGAANVIAGIDDAQAMPTSVDTKEIYSLAGVFGVVLLFAGVGLAGMAVISQLLGKNVGSTTLGWKGLSLEWATASPPVLGNFALAPVVSSSTPLSDENVFPALEATKENEDQKVLTAGGK